jgi:hypothetical protein
LQHTPVTSSNIASVGYDPATREMEVAFTNGSSYRYADVDPKTHASLLAADSVGSHFHQHVRNAHKATPITKAAP